MAGAFQTSREIFNNPIWRNVVEFRLFFLIYGQAVFSEDGCRMGSVKLIKGQWLRSYRSIQSDLEYIENRSVKRYSLSRIKRAVDNLVKDERIKIQECQLGTLFTVINYSKYQGLENYKFNNENAERTGMEQGWNRDGTQREQGWNNNNNVNKDKKEKNVKKEELSDLEKAINDFKDFRNKIKRPMTDYAIHLLRGKLAKLATDDDTKISILNQSIVNGWQGVFALKEDKFNGSPLNPAKPVEGTGGKYPMRDRSADDPAGMS